MTQKIETENRLRYDNLILDSIAEGICVVGTDERISFSNRAADSMFGGRLAEAAVDSYEEIFFRRENDETAVCPIRFALREGETLHVKTETFYRLDNSDFLVEYVCVPLIENDRIVGAVITFEDITERRDIERAIAEARDAALENVRARAAFLANTSHEIRTPLNGIIGTANLLDDTTLDGKQKNYVSMLKTSAGLLLETVNNILDYSKIEAGKSKLEIVEFDFRVLITETVKVFASLANEKGIVFNTFIDWRIPSKLNGDSSRLRQVLNNLLSNALKFTETGEIVLEIRPERAAGENLLLYFSVTDTGIGIEEKQLERLFEPFVQADDSTNRRFGGTGLGLAICREIVAKMNGRIGVESRPRKGSRFWLTAEFERGDVNSNGGENGGKSKQVSISFEKSNLKCLVAEDNSINQQITKEILKQFGIKTEIAANGLEALKKCAESDFDFILMDCRMPEMDGFEATEKIIAQYSRAFQPKIIALTATATNEERERCFAVGMNDFLTKPIDKHDLAKTLNKYFRSETGGRILDLNEKFVQHSLSEVISPATLEKLLEIEARGQKDFISEMVGLYVEYTESGLAEIRAAFAGENYAVIEQKSHGLKGSSANLGADQMAEMFERLEDKVRTRNRPEIEKMIFTLLDKFTDIKQILNKNL